MERIEISNVDITTLGVDAVVNAANERMLGGGGVDGAIHAAAGPELLEACRGIKEVRPGVRCPTGEARITAGFRLPAKFVIHTVGPIWQGGDGGEAELLARCYRSSMELAARQGVVSIAFPAISCGVYGYPLELAATVAMATVRGVLEDRTEFERVVFAAFGAEVEGALQEAWRRSGLAVS
ncbi:O-acetyl-ADP-ribose deacetylase [Myxococcota bacterium]|nr:O-acetyl-ADP-ribose deacetylase [Myxococcota bacterium]